MDKQYLDNVINALEKDIQTVMEIFKEIGALTPKINQQFIAADGAVYKIRKEIDDL